MRKKLAGRSSRVNLHFRSYSGFLAALVLSGLSHLSYANTGCSVNAQIDAIARKAESWIDPTGVNGPTAVVITIGKGYGDNSKIVSSRGFGKMQDGSNVPFDGVFRLASLDKFITDATIKELIRQGRTNPATGKALAANDRVFGILRHYGFWTGTPATANLSNITIQHLIDHSSGIVDFPRPDALTAFEQAYASVGTTPAAAEIHHEAEWIFRQPLAFAPGSGTRYSSSGYYLLRFISHLITGNSFGEYVRENVMARTGTRDVFIASGQWPVVTSSGASREPAYIESVYESLPVLNNALALASSSESYVKFVQHEQYHGDIGQFRDGGMPGSFAYSVKLLLDKEPLLHKDNLATYTVILNKEIPTLIPSIQGLANDLNSLDVSVWNKYQTPHIGVFRNGTWYLDMDNTGLWDATKDKFFTFGQLGDRPVVLAGAECGSGLGRPRIAVVNGSIWKIASANSTGVVSQKQFAFRPGTSNMQPAALDGKPVTFDFSVVSGIERGYFYVDNNSNNVWNSSVDPRLQLTNSSGMAFAAKGDIPVIGRWKGNANNEGRYGSLYKLGLFRPSIGRWYLDINGDQKVDREFSMGQSGDWPVVADFNMDGYDEVGYFHNGVWRIDMSGDFILQNDTDKTKVDFNGDEEWAFGQTGDIPVVSPTPWSQY